MKERVALGVPARILRHAVEGEEEIEEVLVHRREGGQAARGLRASGAPSPWGAVTPTGRPRAQGERKHSAGAPLRQGSGREQGGRSLLRRSWRVRGRLRCLTCLGPPRRTSLSTVPPTTIWPFCGGKALVMR